MFTKEFIKKVVIYIVIFLILIFILNSFVLFEFGIKGTILDAKTQIPLGNIPVTETIRGPVFCPSPGGCSGWSEEKFTKTNENGEFSFPLIFKFKSPFHFVKNKGLLINGYEGPLGGKYDTSEGGYEKYSVVWGWNPGNKFFLINLSKNMSIVDCFDLSDQAKYRCGEYAAYREYSRHYYNSTGERPKYYSETDEYGIFVKAYYNSNYEDYLKQKYYFLLSGTSEDSCSDKQYEYRPSYCDAVLASEHKEINICINAVDKPGYVSSKQYCFFYAGIDLRDKTFCEYLNSTFYTKEKCILIIDNLKI